MLKYEISNPSGSRDTARTRFVTKNVVFCPKNGAPLTQIGLNRGDFFIIIILIISRHAYEVSEAGIVFDLFLLISRQPPLRVLFLIYFLLAATLTK